MTHAIIFLFAKISCDRRWFSLNLIGGVAGASPLVAFTFHVQQTIRSPTFSAIFLIDKIVFMLFYFSGL